MRRRAARGRRGSTSAVDADAEDRGVGVVNVPVRRLVLLHLVGAAGREGGREERDDDVLLALEVGELRPLAARTWAGSPCRRRPVRTTSRSKSGAGSPTLTEGGGGAGCAAGADAGAAGACADTSAGRATRTAVPRTWAIEARMSGLTSAGQSISWRPPRRKRGRSGTGDGRRGRRRAADGFGQDTRRPRRSRRSRRRGARRRPPCCPGRRTDRRRGRTRSRPCSLMHCSGSRAGNVAGCGRSLSRLLIVS